MKALPWDMNNIKVLRKIWWGEAPGYPYSPYPCYEVYVDGKSINELMKDVNVVYGSFLPAYSTGIIQRKGFYKQVGITPCNVKQKN